MRAEVPRLPETQRMLMQAMLDMAPNGAAEVVRRAQVSRASVLNAISALRGISGESLGRALDAMGLSKNFKLLPRVHYWRVGADIKNLVLAINELMPDAQIFNLSGSSESLQDGAQVGYTMFDNGSAIVVVFRDKYHQGRGRRRVFSVFPEDALPLRASQFTGVTAGESPARTLDETRKIESVIDDAFSGKIQLSLDDARGLLLRKADQDVTTETGWLDVMEKTASLGLTPADIMPLLDVLAKRKA